MDRPKKTKNHPIPPKEGEDGDCQSGAESEFEDEDDFPSIPPPGFGDPTSYTQNQLDKLVVLMKQGGKTRVVPLGVGYSLALCLTLSDSAQREGV
jgi:hypothetical protein